MNSPIGAFAERTAGSTHHPRTILLSVVILATLIVPTAALSVPLSGVSTHASPVPLARAAPHGPSGTNPLGPHPNAGIGSVLSTLDLTSGQVIPGPAAPGVQDAPEVAVYDARSGNVYLRGYLGNDLSVLHARGHQVIADVAAPYAQQTYVPVPSMANDSANGEVYVANANEQNVSIVDGGTNRITGSIFTGGSPYGIVYDPANERLYVSNYGANNVTIINATTNRTVGSVPVGTNPAALLLDPALQRLFVANYRSANVSVINTSTDHLLGTVPVGTQPGFLTLDTVDGYLDVLNENGVTGNVTVVNAATLAVVRSVTVGLIPESAVYVPALDRLYVANAGSDNVSVIAQSTNTVVASVPTGQVDAPYSIAYDPVSMTVYVACGGTGNVTIVSTATDRSIENVSTGTVGGTTAFWVPATDEMYVTGTGSSTYESNVTVFLGATNAVEFPIPLNTYPTGVAYDAFDGHVYATDGGGAQTYWANDSTEARLGVAPVGPRESSVGDPMVYDSINHDLYIVDPYNARVVVMGPSHTRVATIPTGVTPVSIVFDPTNGYVYCGTNYDGNVTVIDGSTNTVVGTITVQMYDSLDALAVDPTTNELFIADYSGSNVSVWGATNLTRLASIPVGLAPGSLAYDPENRTVISANYEDANLSIINAVTLRGAGAVRPPTTGPLLYVPATNALYIAASYASALYAINASTYASLPGSPLQMGYLYYVSALAYDPSNERVFVTSADAGTLSMVGLVTTYSITVQESGLPAGTSWSASYGGVTQSGVASSYRFFDPNGSYAYNIPSVPGYSANRSSGISVVNGADVSILIGFAPSSSGGGGSYPVTFTETGLASATRWSVTLNGSTQSSSTTTIQFTEVNGSYPFSVGSLAGYTASPISGTLGVDGGPKGQAITFTPLTSSLSVTLAADPGQLTTGNATVFTTGVSGGSSPYHYVYSGLPSNCTSADSPTLRCVPSSTGTSSVTVNVTDSGGHSAKASTSITVTSPSGSSHPGNGGNGLGLSSWWWVLLIVAIAVVLLIVVAGRRRRQKPAPPSGSDASPGAGPPASPGGTTPSPGPGGTPPPAG